MSARILIVDDQERDRRLAEALFEPYGYAVRSLSSGEEALEEISRDPPDIVLLDVVMMGMSGYDVCRRIRADEATRSIPVVMLTADREQDRVAGLDAGADDFVAKPFDRHELLARVRSLLRIKQYHDTITRQAEELASMNRALEQRVQQQVAEILTLRGLDGTATWRREGEFWTIAFQGSGFRLRDTKGLHYIAALLREPGRERHSLDLVGGDGDDPRPIGGDAGAILDPEAKAQYKARLEELDDDLAEAERLNDVERVSRAREEREAIAHELAAAVGLGGRDRLAASDAERARVNVTRAIRAVLDRIAEHSQALSEHFGRALKTGQFCVYEPGDGVRWQL